MELTFSAFQKEDKLLIHKWEQQYRQTPGFKAIKHFVLEDDMYYNLPELIEINYENPLIGDDEFRDILIAKTPDSEIAGFIVFNVFNLNHKPEVNLIYIAINPVMQHQGIGTQLFTEIFTNYQKYFKCKPTCVFTKIDKENMASQNLAKKFGFKMVKSPQEEECLCGFESDFDKILEAIKEPTSE